MTNTEIIRETVRTAFSAEPLHSMAAAHTSAPSTTAARLKSNGFSRTTLAAKKKISGNWFRILEELSL